MFKKFLFKHLIMCPYHLCYSFSSENSSFSVEDKSTETLDKYENVSPLINLIDNLKHELTKS